MLVAVVVKAANSVYHHLELFVCRGAGEAEETVPHVMRRQLDIGQGQRLRRVVIRDGAFRLAVVEKGHEVGYIVRGDLGTKHLDSGFPFSCKSSSES